MLAFVETLLGRDFAIELLWATCCSGSGLSDMPESEDSELVRSESISESGSSAF